MEKVKAYIGAVAFFLLGVIGGGYFLLNPDEIMAEPGGGGSLRGRGLSRLVHAISGAIGAYPTILLFMGVCFFIVWSNLRHAKKLDAAPKPEA